MLNNILVVATSAAGKELVSKANELAAHTVLVSACPELTGADVVYTVAHEDSIAARLDAIAAVAAELKPELVLCEGGLGGRLVAGYVAAAMKTCPLPEALSVKVGDGCAEITRMVYGGSAIKTESTPLPAVIVVGAGAFGCEDNLRSSEAKELPAVEIKGMELVGIKESAGSQMNLPGAKKVIGCGRGLSSADNLPTVEKLASIMGAEIGCTRPAAEDEGWFEKNRYIGVSGVMIKPNVYFAIGVSGQVQHMVGVDQSGVIFALDKNENAPIFEEADYCLVGNSNTALSAIVEKLS